VQTRLAVVADFAAELRKLGPANFLYADGDALFAHGHRRIQADGRVEPPGLYLLTRLCHAQNQPLQAHGVCVDDDFQQIVLLASVPLSEESWQPLTEGETVAVAAGEVLACHTPTIRP
jgi:glutamine amidotransferase